MKEKNRLKSNSLPTVNCEACGQAFRTSPNPKFRSDYCPTCRKEVRDNPAVYVPRFNGIKDFL